MWIYAALAFLVLVVFLFAYYAFRRAFLRPAPLDFGDKAALMRSSWFAYEPLLTPAVQWVEEQPWEELTISSADGLKLRGRWLPKAGSGKAVLLFHGYASMPHNDFCLTARWAKKKGYSVLLADQRAYGASEGTYTTMGLRESEDCRLWAEAIAAKLGPDCRLVLGGVSMGATTVLMALDGKLPDNVRAIVADSGYRSVKGMMRHVVRSQLRMRGFPLLQIVGLYCRLAWGVWPAMLDTVELLRNNAAIPVFFAHGKADLMVPYEMTEEAYNACAAPKALFTAENAGHGASALVETERYFTELDAFLNAHL